jgi:hypothetical protein
VFVFVCLRATVNDRSRSSPCLSQNRDRSLSAQYRVKPGPDPTRKPNETEWLSQSQIDEEVMKPSYSWVESGTGTLGRMFVEILKCDGLPNLDSRIGSIETGYTDAFCCLIFEDSILNTDVIRDDLNPRCTSVLALISRLVLELFLP